MPTIEQQWGNAVYTYRENPDELFSQGDVYRLSQSFGLLLLQRRYSDELSSQDLSDILASASSIFLERARQDFEVPHPMVYFFFLCLRQARNFMRKREAPLDEREKWEERANIRIRQLQNEPKSPEVAFLLAESVGDLFRAGGILRRDQRTAYKSLPEELMRACTDRITKQARELADYIAGSLDVADRRSVEDAFLVRDRLESARLGLMYWSMENNFDLQYGNEVSTREFKRLDEQLSALETSFNPIELLGDRAALIDPLAQPLYLEALEERELPPPATIDDLSEEVLTSFLCEGEFDSAIQRLVKQSTEAREILRDLLASAHLVQLPRSLAARRLERSIELHDEEDALQERNPTARSEDMLQVHPVVTAIPIELPRLQQSATVNSALFSEEKLREVDLGKIPEHDAHLSIVAEVDSPVLVVHQGREMLTSASFGNQTHPRDGKSTWQIPLGFWPKPNEPIRATFHFKDGPPIIEEFCFPDMPEMPQVTKRH